MRAIHPVRAQKLQQRKLDVARQKNVLEAVWIRAKSLCEKCGVPVLHYSPTARTVGRVKFHGPVTVENGRLLCGLHFHGMIISHVQPERQGNG